MSLTTANNIDDLYEARTALEILTETRRSVLTEGLNFNTDIDWELTADSNGYIALPPNLLRFESKGDKHLIMKDNKVYDKSKHTFIFDASSTHKINATWDMDFDDVPHAIAYYIAVKTARIAYQRLIGSTEVIRVLMDDEQQAKFKMIDHDVDTSNYSIFDVASTRQTIQRDRNPVGIRG